MTRHVLVPFDGAAQSAAALEYALRARPGHAVTALYVVDLFGDVRVDADPIDRQRDELEAHGKDVIDEAVEIAADVGVEIETDVRIGVPHRDILEYVTEHDVDHVVLGGHGHSPIDHPFLGQVSETVVRRAPVSTTVVPVDRDAFDDYDVREGTVLVPVDGSEQATAALEYAAAAFPDADITALHVIVLPFEYSSEELEGSTLERFLSVLRGRGEDVLASTVETADVDAAHVRRELTYGKPTRAIVDYALDYRFDQVVMGIHGRARTTRLLTGSVAESVARRASFPVTLVRDAHPRSAGGSSGADDRDA